MRVVPLEKAQKYGIFHLLCRILPLDKMQYRSNVVVSPGVILGNNVKVQNNVSIYTGVTYDDDVFLGPSMLFTNVINPRSAINRRGQYFKTNVGRGDSVGENAAIVCLHYMGA
jgi:UDP-2-acetamido-3-amino-2,3-dideoxy-glucuronate N-acetyltransferase